MVVERKREEFVDRTGDTIGIENGSWTILKLWKIGITTYSSKFQGIQALALLSLPWLGSPPVACMGRGGYLGISNSTIHHA